MSDEDALLAGICAASEDDTARLAFADLLDERGGPVEEVWAKFIRAHVRLGTGTEMAGDIPTVMELGSGEWLTRFATRLGFPSDGVGVGDWDRGLPSGLSGPYPAVRERWDELTVRVPFRQLRVLEIDDASVEDLVLWPRLERLTALDLTTWDGDPASDVWPPQINEWALSERGVAALASCPALNGLEALALSFLDVTDRIADLILQSRHLRRLQKLTLRAGEHFHLPERYWYVRDRLASRFGSFAVH